MILFKGHYVSVESLDGMVTQGDFTPEDVADALRESHGEMFILMLNIYSAKIKSWYPTFAAKHGECRIEADDYVMEVWLRVAICVERGWFWKGTKKRGHKNAGFKTWLYRIADSVFRERLRKENKTVKTVDLATGEGDEGGVCNNSALEELGKLAPPWFMSDLPHHYDNWGNLMRIKQESKAGSREVDAFIARRIQSVSAKDYAEATAQAISTVNMQADRCAKKLRDMMDENY